MREGEDFLYVASNFVNDFVAHAAPAILFTFLYRSRNNWLYLENIEMVSIETENQGKLSMIKTIAILAWFQAGAILALIFNPFDSDRLRKRYKFFDITAKTIFYGCCIMQVLLPITIFIYIVFLWSPNNISDSYLRLPLLFYLILLGLDFFVRADHSYGLFVGRLMYQPEDEDEEPNAEPEKEKAYMDVTP